MNKQTSHIIFLNGTSSSGKSTIAKKLSELDNFEYLSIDDFINEQSSITGTNLRNKFPKIVHKFHQKISELTQQNKNLIIDHVLEKPEWYEACKEALRGGNITWVSVICPLEELEKREAKRKDRKPGLARFQYNILYKNYKYDIQIDTSITSPKQAAFSILTYAKLGM